MLTATPALERLLAAARRPVPADSVALFRIGFGLLAAASSTRFLARGWVDTLYLAPEHHLTYRWLGWVEPLPAPWMHLHVAALAVLGLAIAAGWHHRLAASAFVVGFAWAEAIDAALYLNHYWFVTLAGVLVAILPVHHHRSMDAITGRVSRHAEVAAGVVWTLRAQVAVVYVFAGLAKLNPDWLWRAQPLRLWLADRADVAIIGPVLDEPAVAYLASWSGALFDLTIVGWLLWPRSRGVAWAVLVAFHLVTGALFPAIGVFPVVMIAASTVFFAPCWPRRLASSARQALPTATTAPGTPRTPRPVVAGLLALAVVQVVLPLRHLTIADDVRWTEEGYLLAWRVMLTEKAGHVEYEITDPVTGERFLAHPEVVLTDWQAAVAATRPDLIHATAHLLAEHYDPSDVADEEPRRTVEVRADAWVAMNGRPRHRIIDPELDLVAHPRGQPPDGWILAAPP